MKRVLIIATLVAVVIVVGGVFVWSKTKSPISTSQSVSEINEPSTSKINSRIPASISPLANTSHGFASSASVPVAANYNDALEQDAQYQLRRGQILSKRWGQVDKLRDKTKPVKFSNNGHDYEFLPDVYALPRDKYVASSSLTPVDQAWGYVFVQTASGQPAPAGAFPAAVSPAEHSLIVVTGAVSVKFNTPGISEPFGQDFGIHLLSSLDEINVAYYQGSDTSAPALINLVDSLRRDPRVVRANLQIVDRRYVSK